MLSELSLLSIPWMVDGRGKSILTGLMFAFLSALTVLMRYLALRDLCI